MKAKSYLVRPIMTRAIGFSKRLVLALLAFLVAASVGVVGFTIAQADDAEDSEITVYFIRHWEKKDSYTIEVLDDEFLVIPEELAELGNEVPRSYRELSGLGVEKANRFPDWLTERGIEPTHLISTHKNRTFFSLRPTSIEFGIPIDLVHDPECVLPVERIGPGETPDLLGLKEQLGACRSNNGTINPNLDAIEALASGDVAIVAQHSGSHWPIFTEMLGHPLLDGPPFDEH